MPEIINISEDLILNKIYLIRRQKVMLDRDLAEMYGVDTKVLNQNIKRNKYRFPEDFMFQLTETEWNNLKSQIVTSSWGGVRKLPYVFTELGVAMLSSVLNSPIAIQVNIQIIRIFTKMRQQLINNQDVLIKLAKLDKQLFKLDRRTELNEKEIEYIFETLNQLITKENETKPPRKRIGFITS